MPIQTYGWQLPWYDGSHQPRVLNHMVGSYHTTMVVTYHAVQAYGWQLPWYGGSHQPSVLYRMVGSYHWTMVVTNHVVQNAWLAATVVPW
jgi:hypothetical protein